VLEEAETAEMNATSSPRWKSPLGATRGRILLSLWPSVGEDRGGSAMNRTPGRYSGNRHRCRESSCHGGPHPGRISLDAYTLGHVQ
jgi:hypothetical protein